MSESVRLLKGIMKTSGWTQEQVAEKLGVSFQTMNAWVNGKSRPRKTMRDKIRKLYLAQDITKDIEPTYVTLIEADGLIVGDALLFEKSNGMIKVYKLGLDANCKDYMLGVQVADLVDNAVSGTSLANQVYDRFEKKARARVLFVFQKIAIAKVVEWNYAEKGA